MAVSPALVIYEEEQYRLVNLVWVLLGALDRQVPRSRRTLAVLSLASSCDADRSSTAHTDLVVTHTAQQGNRRLLTSHAVPPGESRWIIRQWPVSVFASLCEEMTSSTKPEVHNVLHCHRLTCGSWDMRVDRQTHRQTDKADRHHHTTTTVLRPFFRNYPGEPEPERNFWTSWCKGRLTEVNTLTIRLGATPSGLTSSHLHHPRHLLQATCPSWRPTNSVKALKATSAFGLGRYARGLTNKQTETEW